MLKNQNLKKRFINIIQKELDNHLNSDISPSAYDTAWVARIPLQENLSQPMFPESIKWIKDNQQNDGSWGGSKYFHYYFDTIIQTLSSIIMLKEWYLKKFDIPIEIIDKGKDYVNNNINKINNGYYKTAGFELILPSLIKEAKELSIEIDDSEILKEIKEQADKKLSKLPINYITKYPTTALHSLEGLSGLEIDWKDILSIIDKDGGLMTSPSATAFLSLKILSPALMVYLRKITKDSSSVPVAFSIQNFEINWMMEILTNLSLSELFPEEYKSNLQFLSLQITQKGVSWANTFDVPDLDDTAVTYYLLKKNNIFVDGHILSNFIREDQIFCFANEVEGSPTHIFHLLQALLLDPVVNSKQIDFAYKVAMQFIEEKGWLDKWHLSEFYVKAIAFSPLSSLDANEAKKILNSIIETQRIDGGWGTEKSNIEESAWAMYTLILSHQIKSMADKDLDIKDVLEKGLEYLSANYSFGMKFDALWIGKTLYAPNRIINCLIVSIFLFFTDNIHN